MLRTWVLTLQAYLYRKSLFLHCPSTSPHIRFRPHELHFRLCSTGKKHLHKSSPQIRHLIGGHLTQLLTPSPDFRLTLAAVQEWNDLRERKYHAVLQRSVSAKKNRCGGWRSNGNNEREEIKRDEARYFKKETNQLKAQRTFRIVFHLLFCSYSFILRLAIPSGFALFWFLFVTFTFHGFQRHIHRFYLR